MNHKKNNFQKIKAIIIITVIFLAFFVFTNKIAYAGFTYETLEALPGFFVAGASPNLPTLILSIYKFGIWTVGIAGLFMLTIGGFMYMASAGNNARVTTAKEIITDSLLGIAAAMCAYLIIYIINPDMTRINTSFPQSTVQETTP